MKSLPEYLLVRVDTKTKGEILKFMSEEEVKNFQQTGYWQEVVNDFGLIGKYGWVWYKCSNCEAWANTPYKFCPHCGSRMDQYECD